MINSEVYGIKINNIRLWDNNPRHTSSTDIDIEFIGKKSFEFSEDNDELIADKYEQLKKVIYINLISTYDQCLSMYDLIESLSTGFNSGIDEIVVVKPDYLAKFTETDDFKYIKEIYYVVEGNRRVMAMQLLTNENNERKILEEYLESLREINDKSQSVIKIISKLKGIIKLLNEFNSNAAALNIVDCRILDYYYYISNDGIRVLNTTLNSKHFGVRKGKLNWPRGLMIKKIYLYVKKYLKSNSKSETHEMKKMCQYIESKLGKKIGPAEINQSIFITESIDLWNKHSEKQIEYKNTEPGDIWAREFTSIIEDGEDEESSETYLNFSISALELSFSKIELLNNDLKPIKLGKVLIKKFNFESINNLGFFLVLKDEKNGKEKMISDEQKLQIVQIIIKGILEKKLDTRKCDDSIGQDLRGIIFTNSITNDSDVLDLSLSDIEKVGTITQGANKYKDFFELISEILKAAKEIDETEFLKKENVFMETIQYIWKLEYGRIIKFKEKTKLRDLPILIFAALSRSTFEHICMYIFINMVNEYIDKFKLWKNKIDDYQKACKDRYEVLLNQFGCIRNKDITTLGELELSKHKNAINLLLRSIAGEDYPYDVKEKIDSEYIDREWICLENYKKTQYNGQNLLNNIIKDNEINFFEEILKPKLKESNFLGLVEKEKCAPMIEFLEVSYKLWFGDNTNNLVRKKNDSYFKWNRLIHRPSYAYLSNGVVKELTEILNSFYQLEKLILEILKDKHN